MLGSGNIKPPVGFVPNFNHPFMYGHIMSILFDGSGTFPRWTSTPAAIAGGPRVIWSGAKAAQDITVIDSAPSIFYSSNTQGIGLLLQSENDRMTIPSSAFLPTTKCTILTIFRNLVDPSVISSGLLFYAGAAAAGQCYAFTPVNSGDTIFNFGNNSDLRGDTTLSTLTSYPRKMAFVAGSKGRHVWQDGVKVLTSATGVSRSSETDLFYINGSGASNGIPSVELNFFMVINEEWSDDMIRWWTAMPYDHLYDPMEGIGDLDSSGLVATSFSPGFLG